MLCRREKRLAFFFCSAARHAVPQHSLGTAGERPAGGGGGRRRRRRRRGGYGDSHTPPAKETRARRGQPHEKDTRAWSDADAWLADLRHTGGRRPLRGQEVAAATSTRAPSDRSGHATQTARATTRNGARGEEGACCSLATQVRASCGEKCRSRAQAVGWCGPRQSPTDDKTTRVFSAARP